LDAVLKAQASFVEQKELASRRCLPASKLYRADEAKYSATPPANLKNWIGSAEVRRHANVLKARGESSWGTAATRSRKPNGNLRQRSREEAGEPGTAARLLPKRWNHQDAYTPSAKFIRIEHRPPSGAGAWIATSRTP